MANSPLDDRFEDIMDTLQDVPPPDPALKAESRRELVLRAARLPAQPVKSGWFSFLLKPVPMIGALAALVVMVLIGVFLIDGPGQPEAVAEPPSEQAPTIPSDVSPTTPVETASVGNLLITIDTGAIRLHEFQIDQGPAPIEVAAGDTLTIDSQQVGFLVFDGGSTVAIDGGTTLTVAELQTSADAPYRVDLRLSEGRVFSHIDRKLGEGELFAISTGTATAEVRGTAFGIETLSDGAVYVHTLEGTVNVTSDGQEAEVNPGEETVAQDGEPLEVHPQGTKLSEQLGVPAEDIIGWFETGYGLGQVKQIYEMSSESGLKPEEYFELRESGLGLGTIKQLDEIAANNDVTLAELVEMLESGMSLGQIKQEYKDKSDDDKDNGQGPPGGEPPGQDKKDDEDKDNNGQGPPGGVPPGQDKKDDKDKDNNGQGPPGGVPPGQDKKDDK